MVLIKGLLVACLKDCQLQEKSHTDPECSPGRQRNRSSKPQCMKSTNSSVHNFGEGLIRSADLGSESCPHCCKDNELIFISSAGNSTYSSTFNSPCLHVCSCQTRRDCQLEKDGFLKDSTKTAEHQEDQKFW